MRMSLHARGAGGPSVLALALLLAALLAVAGLLLAVSAQAQPAAHPAAHPAKGGQPGEAARKTIVRPLFNAPAVNAPAVNARAGKFGLRSMRNPDAGLAALPRLGQIPSVAGGIPRLDAAGFAPEMPVFRALQPTLPEGGALPRRRGHHRGRGAGQERGEPPRGCAEEGNGVVVWRGDCDD